MSIDPKFGRYCDGCGRGIVNAVRVHLGKDYCRSCYQTNFVKVQCTACQGPMREHKHATGEPTCNACKRSSRTCLRCGKFTLVAGKLVGNSAVCAACAPYFREKQPCSSCGQMSSRLSRPLFAGMKEPVCDSCRSRLSHATCSTCRRYRAVAGHSDDGSKHCKDCVPGQQVSHACPDCGAQVPGGGLGRCRTCVTRLSVHREAALCAASFEGERTKDIWHAFVQQQLEAAPESPKLISQIQHASTFFREFDRHFSREQDVSAQALSERIESRFMRSHLLASRFVVQALALNTFDETRALASEQRRAADVLTEAEGARHGALVLAYDQWLTEMGTAARTKRLYLRVAQDFCTDGKVDSDTPWVERQAIRYLTARPGQAANLGRFINFCKRSKGWDVKLPTKELWKGKPPQAQERVKALRKALASAEGASRIPATSQALARVLSLALDVPAAQLLRARANGDVKVHTNGDIEVTVDGRIAVSDPLYPIAQRWVELGARGRALA